MQCEEIWMSLREPWDLRAGAWRPWPGSSSSNWRTVKQEVDSEEPWHYP